MNENTKDLTPGHVANLRKLAAYLRSGDLKANFDMVDYSAWGWEAQMDVTECGSVGCAIGHGPHAGVAKHVGEGWRFYSRRVFGLVGPLWDWCFAGRWFAVDNTPEGAAERIEWMLDGHPVPGTYGRMFEVLYKGYRSPKFNPVDVVIRLPRRKTDLVLQEV